MPGRRHRFAHRARHLHGRVRAPGTPHRRAGVFGVFGAVATFHLVDHRRLPPARQVPAHAAVGPAAVLVALLLGADRDTLGLDPRRVPAGLVAGFQAAAVTVVSVAVAANVPALEPFFADPRVAGATDAEVRHKALVEIPVGTVFYEELVFRSALLGLALDELPARQAVLLTSGLFGLWHVLPALEDRNHNEAVASYPLVATIGPTVASTALAGLWLSRLRLRSGSVVAPMLAHLASNVSALVAASVVSRRTARRALPEDLEWPDDGPVESPVVP